MMVVVVGMHISLPIRRNHIGKISIPPSLSSVAKFAIRVSERSSSISDELRIGGPSYSGYPRYLIAPAKVLSMIVINYCNVVCLMLTEFL